MLYLRLGAPLYIPATHRDLLAIANGLSLKEARSVIFCTEDAILKDELPLALSKLADSLPKMKPQLPGNQENIPFRCIRPRSMEVLQKILDMEGISSIQAFVLPKVTQDSLQQWLNILRPYPEFRLMVTLETLEVFEPDNLRRLRDQLLASPLRNRIICLRIGALDLLGQLGLRRACNKTIYTTPIEHYIYDIITMFGSAGFFLSAPAFECITELDVLREEVELDVLNGLFCKSAIHPVQLETIHKAYRVDPNEWEEANAILDPASPAVFRLHGRMCEKATHSDWAQRIILRASIYGFVDDL